MQPARTGEEKNRKLILYDWKYNFDTDFFFKKKLLVFELTGGIILIQSFFEKRIYWFLSNFSFSFVLKCCLQQGVQIGCLYQEKGLTGKRKKNIEQLINEDSEFEIIVQFQDEL